MLLTVLKSIGQVFCSKSLMVFDIFLMTRLVFLGKVSLSSHHPRGSDYQPDLPLDVHLDYLAEIVFVRFPTVKFLFFSPFPYCKIFGKKSLYPALIYGVGSCAPSP